MLLTDLASGESNLLVWLVTPTFGLIPVVWLTSSYALRDVEYIDRYELFTQPIYCSKKMTFNTLLLFIS